MLDQGFYPCFSLTCTLQCSTSGKFGFRGRAPNPQRFCHCCVNLVPLSLSRGSPAARAITERSWWDPAPHIRVVAAAGDPEAAVPGGV